VGGWWENSEEGVGLSWDIVGSEDYWKAGGVLGVDSGKVGVWVMGIREVESEG